MVGSKDHFRRRVGPRLCDQLVEAGELEIAGQEHVAAGEGDVEHDAAGVVARLGVPAGGGCRTAKDTPLVSHASRCCHRPNRDTARLGFARAESIAAGLASPPNPGVTRTTPMREAVEQVDQAVVVILIGMAQEDRVDPADASRPERRRDDPAADARVAQAAAVVQERATIGRLDQHRQAVPDRQKIGLGGRGLRRGKFAASSQPGNDPAQEQPPGNSTASASRAAKAQALDAERPQPAPRRCRRPAPNPMPARPRSGAPTLVRPPRERLLWSHFRNPAAPQASGAPSGPQIVESASPSPPKSRAAVVNGIKGMFKRTPIGEIKWKRIATSGRAAKQTTAEATRPSTTKLPRAAECLRHQARTAAPAHRAAYGWAEATARSHTRQRRTNVVAGGTSQINDADCQERELAPDVEKIRGIDGQSTERGEGQRVGGPIQPPDDRRPGKTSRS